MALLEAACGLCGKTREKKVRKGSHRFQRLFYGGTGNIL